MLRWTPFAASLALLAACSQSGSGRQAISDRCIAGGELPEICHCLADASVRRLEKDMFNLVVLGAKGEETETDRRIKAMPAERQLRFSLAVREITRSCGAENYLAAN